MARIKYYYDTETCKYERVKASVWEVLLNFIGLFVVTLLIAAGLVFLYIKVVPNKKVIALKKENKILMAHKDNVAIKLDETKKYIEYLQDKDKNIYLAVTGTELREDSNSLSLPGEYLERLKKGVKIPELIREKSRLIDSLILSSEKEKEQYITLIRSLSKDAKKLQHIPAIQPIENIKLKRLASGFGYRTHPLYKLKVKHKGIDFSAPEGTPVYATANGMIEIAEENHKDAGVFIKIDHGYEYKTTYSHMQRFIVKQGETVKRGQIIGYVGSSGKALSSHLGYEILYKGNKVDPVHYFFIDTNSEDWHKLLELARLDNQTLS